MSDYKFRLVDSLTTNPYVNLATEWYLTDSPRDACYFFLWVNKPVVVIGYNQNPFSECNLEKMNKDGVLLSRRRTGGGAVYHDAGNLNFSFVMPEKLYDVNRQSAVIVGALGQLGIRAEQSGRNDLLADGRKFSGNAYYKGKTHRLHHGTLMIDVDFDALSAYLTPDPSKYLKKGVSSVRSRVVNLSDLNPEITTTVLKNALFKAFCNEYGCEEVICNAEKDFKEISALASRISSEDYLYGKWRNFSCEKQAVFSWGSVRADVRIENCIISRVIFSTDGLYPSAVEFAEKYFSSGKAESSFEEDDKIVFPREFGKEDEKVFYDLRDLVLSNGKD